MAAVAELIKTDPEGRIICQGNIRRRRVKRNAKGKLGAWVKVTCDSCALILYMPDTSKKK
jgi:hypothetical protein